MHDQGSLKFTTAKQDYEITQDLLDLFGQERAERYGALPLARRGNVLIIAISRQDDEALIAQIQEDIGLTIAPLFTEFHKIQDAMDRYYDPEWRAKRERKAMLKKEREKALLALETAGKPEPDVKLFELILLDACCKDATRIVWKLLPNFGLNVLCTIDGEDIEAMKPPYKLTGRILKLVWEHTGTTPNTDPTQSGTINYERGGVQLPPIESLIDMTPLVYAPELATLTPKQEKELRERCKPQGRKHDSPSALLVASMIHKSALFFESCSVIFEKTSPTKARILFDPEFVLHAGETFPAELFEPIYHHLLERCNVIRRPGRIPSVIFRRLPPKPKFEYGEYKIPFTILGQVFKVHVRMFLIGDRQFIEINPPPPHRLSAAGVFDDDDDKWAFGDEEFDSEDDSDVHFFPVTDMDDIETP